MNEATLRRLALRNYCIASGIYDQFVNAMLTKKTESGVVYVHPELASKFTFETVPMFSPYIWDWYKAEAPVPTVPEFIEKLGRNKLAKSA